MVTTVPSPAAIYNPSPETSLPVRYHVPIEKVSYDDSCVRYEETTYHKLRNTDTFILGGYGCHIKVEHRALVLDSAYAHKEERQETRLYKGVSKIKQIIVCSDGGYITLDAIKWCADEDVTVLLLDWHGLLVQVLAPKHQGNAKLIWQQYQATQNNLAFSISVELVRRKAQAQLRTLAHYAHLPKQKIAAETIEIELANLERATTVNRVRMIEAVMASAYFSVFFDLPLRWHTTVKKTLPPHWMTITNRTSPLAKGHGAWHAVNPFHAALNFAYALLQGQILQAIYAAGLEPTCGYLHPIRGDRVIYSLACDLQEPLRAKVDAKVLALFQKTTFKRGDFYQVLSGECRMNEQLRRYVLATCRVPQEEIDDLVSWLIVTLGRE